MTVLGFLCSAYSPDDTVERSHLYYQRSDNNLPATAYDKKDIQQDIIL